MTLRKRAQSPSEKSQTPVFSTPPPAETQRELDSGIQLSLSPRMHFSIMIPKCILFLSFCGASNGQGGGIPSSYSAPLRMAYVVRPHFLPFILSTKYKDRSTHDEEGRASSQISTKCGGCSLLIHGTGKLSGRRVCPPHIFPVVDGYAVINTAF